MCFRSSALAAALALAPATIAAEVEVVLVAEITERTIIAFGADARLAPSADVGDLVILSLVYDDGATGNSGALGTSYPATSAGITIGTWDSSLFVVDEPRLAGIALEDSSGFDAVFLAGALEESQLNVILFDTTGQSLSDETLRPCLELGGFATEVGEFRTELRIQGGGILCDYDFEIVGQLSGFCDGVDRPYAVAKWRPAQTSVGGETVRVELDGSDSLGDGEFFTWIPQTAGTPSPADPFVVTTFVDLPPGTHRYRLVADNGQRFTDDEVEIVIGDGPANDCPADVNGDGQATPADFTAWLQLFNAGPCPE